MNEALEQTPNLSGSLTLHIGNIPQKASLSLEMYYPWGGPCLLTLHTSLGDLTQMVWSIFYLLVNPKFRIYSLSLCLLLTSPLFPPLLSSALVHNNRPFAFPCCTWRIHELLETAMHIEERLEKKQTQNKNPNKTQNQPTKTRSLWHLQPVALLTCPTHSSVLSVLLSNKQPLGSSTPRHSSFPPPVPVLVISHFTYYS